MDENGNGNNGGNGQPTPKRKGFQKGNKWRFPPGKSANPGGRPLSGLTRRDMRHYTHEILDELVDVEVSIVHLSRNNKTGKIQKKTTREIVKMTKGRALALKQYEKAMERDSDAATKLLYNYDAGLPEFTGKLSIVEPPYDDGEGDAELEAIRAKLAETNPVGRTNGNNGNGSHQA